MATNYEGEQLLTPAEQQAAGLAPPAPMGPLGSAPQTAPPQSAGFLERLGRIGPAFKQNLQREGPSLLGTAAAGLLPVTRPVLGPLLRSGLGTAVAGAARKLFGGGSSTEEMAKFAGTQIPAELGFGVARLGLGQVGAKRALAQAETKFQAALKQHAEATEQAKRAYQTDLKQFTETAIQNEAMIAQQARTHAEKGAKIIADSYKSEVPSWKDFPSNEQGLAEMVYGKGQGRVSQTYDKALKEVVESGRGIQVPMRVEDVDVLELRPTGFLDAGKGQPKPTHAFVDAGDLAQALPGKWKTNRGTYRRGFEALDRQGLGNEQARSEYRSAQSLIEFTDKSKMLAGGKFDPEAARKALYSLKTVDALRKRGEGDVFRGPIAEFAQTEVPPSRPLPEPVKPEKPSPLKPPEKPDIKIKKTPVSPMTKFHIGGALAEAPALISGYRGFGPYVFGGLAGQAVLPRSVYTGPGVPNPVTPPILPTTIAEMLRQHLFQPRPGTTSTQK